MVVVQSRNHETHSLFAYEEPPGQGLLARRRIDGIGWAAIASLGLFVAGIVFVIGSYLTYRPETGQLVAQDAAPAFVKDLEVIILPKSTRDLLAKGKTQSPAPAQSTKIALAQRTWPRLKPQIATAARPIAKSIDMNARWLAQPVHYGFAPESEFTGGVEPLFTKYQPVDFSDAPQPQEELRLKKGETLAGALDRAGVTADQTQELTTALDEEINLRTLKPGTKVTLHTQQAADGRQDVIWLELPLDRMKRVRVSRDVTGNFAAAVKVANTTTHYAAIRGTITDSLFASAARAGMPHAITARFANMFLYDVDFQRAIRKGDSFEAVYEVYYDENGNIAGYGDVVYGHLSWLNQTREKGYYRFVEDGKAAWYDAAGKSARRLLMKTPIEGARISSGYGNRRHPILGYNKMHRGVDFAARRGTPIMAAGDGVVERADRFGSFGNYVRIRHSNGYKTAYAHLKGFGKNVRKGKRVRQGQIIGYVGTTGRSTGPHLHYEVMHRGMHVNPMTIDVGKGKALKADELDEFLMERDWINRLRHPQPREVLVLAQN